MDTEIENGGAVVYYCVKSMETIAQINRDTTSHKQREMETEIKREMEMTITTGMTVLNKTTPIQKQENEIKRETETSLRQQIHEYKTPGNVFYLL